MLAMRPACERCDAGTPADVEGAFICSFECTFCRACAEGTLERVCPNCGRALRERPTRIGDSLRRHPARAA